MGICFISREVFKSDVIFFVFKSIHEKHIILNAEQIAFLRGFMNICILSLRGITEGIPGWGGVNTHAKKLVNLLTDQGYEVSLITSAGEETKNGLLTTIPVKTNSQGRPDAAWFEGAYKSFMRVHKDRPVSCVFSEAGSVRGLIKLLKHHQIPIVTFTHLLSIHYFHNAWQEIDGLRAFKSYVFRRVPTIIHDIISMDIAFLHKCQKVVTGSSTIAQQMKRYYHLPDDKVMVIHNWVDPDEFRYDENARYQFRKKLNVLDNDIVFLLVGAVWKPKGFRIALHSFKELLETVHNSYLVIAGDGPDRSYLESYMRHNEELSQRVKLLGACSHSDLPTVFSAGDVFVIPSLMDEVLPYTLLEAMSCKMPVIATSIFANKEALGERGYFVPRGNVESLTRAMVAFASDLSNKKAEAAYNRGRIVKLFSSEMASRKINKLIKEIV